MNGLKIALWGLFFGICLEPLEATIRFLTFHYNKPDFLELQHRTLQKFMQEEYELIVFNDAKLPELEEEIRSTCERLNIPCIRYEQSWHFNDPLNDEVLQALHDPSVRSILIFGSDDLEGVASQPSIRHSHVIQYAMDHFGYNHDDIVVLLDGDMFPIRDLDIRALLQGYELLGPYRSILEDKIGYLWVPFIAIDMPKIVDKANLRFSAGRVGNHIYDTGAALHEYLKLHPKARVKKYGWHRSTDFYRGSLNVLARHGFNRDEMKFTRELPWPQCVEFHIDHCLLHFAGSSFDIEGHDIKSQYLTDFLNYLLAKK